MSLDAVRAVADAVLYEGYLLYPYRATSGKNQVRWQFGVLGPPGAEDAGIGEASCMSMQCLMRDPGDVGDTRLRLHLRFLQVQSRRPQRARPGGAEEFVDVPELVVGPTRWLSWDEAVEVEHPIDVGFADLRDGLVAWVDVPAGEDIEVIADEGGGVAGRLVRQRTQVQATVHATADQVSGIWRLSVRVDNAASAPSRDKDDALRRSLVGTHVVIEAVTPGCTFVSVIDPPEDAKEAAAACQQDRCWPVLGGPEGDSSVVLGSPIILYDHPEIAEQSAGALFDSTEIDEILTLRVMTMSDEEKAEARATDPRAAEIIDRCDQMSPADLQRMHGILRDPFGATPDPFAADPFATDKPWWDPESEATVNPEADFVVVQGVRVANGSFVRIHPNRRADAQDLFFSDQVARVTAVHRDVDGETHVAVVLVDDPAADLHDWYGRYLYFAPDEVEPLPTDSFQPRKESRP